MSQNKGLICMIQTKLNLINIQKEELLTVLDRYVSKQTDEAVRHLQIDVSNVDQLRTVNSNLEAALNLLFKTYENFDGLAEDVPQLRAETSHNVITSPITKKSQLDSPVAVEFNRRLELLEIAATFQDEQNRSLMSALEKQQRALEEQTKVCEDALNDVELRRASEMLTLKLQRDDMEDNLTGLMSNVKSLHDMAKEHHKYNSETFADKRMLCEVLEQSGKTEKLAEQLAGSLEAVEFDVKNVMDWHKELEKECQVTNVKVGKMEVRVQSCVERLGQEEMNLMKLVEDVRKLEETGNSEIKPLKESYENVNQAAKQRLDECEKELGTFKRNLEHQEVSIATTASTLQQEVLRQRKACKDNWEPALQKLKGELQKECTSNFGIYQAGNTTLSNVITQMNQRLGQCEQGASSLKIKLDQHDKNLSLSVRDVTMRRLMTVTSSELKTEIEASLEKLKNQNEEKMNEMALNQLETIKKEIISARGQKTSAGFTANLEGYRSFDKNDIVKPYKLVSAENSSFDAITGEFAAHHDGTYLSLFTLMQSGEGRITAHVCRLPSWDTGLKLVCKTMTSENGATSSAAGYIRLAAGEKLALRIISMSDDAKLTPYTFFTCCLVNS